MRSATDELDCAIPLRVVKTPWFIDHAHVNVFTGYRYNYRCVCLIGQKHSDLTMLRSTQNPRRCVFKMQPDTEDAFVVKEAVWSAGKSSDLILEEALKILSAAQKPVGEWFVIPTQFHLPLLRLAAEKAGVAVVSHAEFADAVKRHETGKLRAYLTKAGVDRSVAQAHRYV